jgi:hypothetical protein
MLADLLAERIADLGEMKFCCGDNSWQNGAGRIILNLFISQEDDA